MGFCESCDFVGGFWSLSSMEMDVERKEALLMADFGGLEEMRAVFR